MTLPAQVEVSISGSRYIHVTLRDNPNNPFSVTHNLRRATNTGTRSRDDAAWSYNHAINGLQTLVAQLYANGVDVASPNVVKAIQQTLDDLDLDYDL